MGSTTALDYTAGSKLSSRRGRIIWAGKYNKRTCTLSVLMPLGKEGLKALRFHPLGRTNSDPNLDEYGVSGTILSAMK